MAETPIKRTSHLALLTTLIATLAVSQLNAATLKWRPYRPVTAEERAAFARPIDGPRVVSNKSAPPQASSDDRVIPTAAVQADKDNPLADPFQDGAAATKKSVDDALDGLNLDDTAAPSSNTVRPKAEAEPDPFEDEPLQVPDKFPSDSSAPEKLAPQDDYFPEERVPEMKRESQALPDEESAPDTGTPSLSDELREMDSNGGATDCKSEKADCADALIKLKANTLANIDLDIAVNGVEGQDFPCECAFGVGETFMGRHWTCVTYNWKASGLCHKPLYFEQVAVERYGHSMPTLVQDVMCGAHFFASIPALPYMMGLCPPDECQYSLGYYRPGNCAPYLIDPIPLSLRAGLFEAGAIVGGILIIP